MARELKARTTSAGETTALGQALARMLAPGDTLLLAGDLGAGKTTLTKGLAAGLGVEELVTSPTFTLVKSYPCTGSGTDVSTLVHADLFRLDGLTEVAELAIGELLEEDACAVVEWGDLARPVFGVTALVVNLSYGTGPTERLVTVEVPESWSQRLAEVESALGRWLDGRGPQEDRQE